MVFEDVLFLLEVVFLSFDCRRVAYISPPGGGKDTQSDIFRDHYGFEVVIMSSLLNRRKSEDAHFAQRTASMDKGSLLSDQDVWETLMPELQARNDTLNLLLNGAPRRCGQAISLIEYYLAREEPLTLINFGKMNLELLKDRIHRRWLSTPVEERRPDDHPSVVHTRFEEYDQHTVPMIAYIKSQLFKFPQTRLHTIDGSLSIPEVTKQIKDYINDPAGVTI